MLQSTAYTNSGQVSLPTMPPTGTYSNYHPFAHLSDFCVPVNFDNSATYFGAAAVYANSYPSHNFGIKADQASCSTTLLNDTITSYTNLDEGKENINPMRSRSSSLGNQNSIKLENQSEISNSKNCAKDFKCDDEEIRYRERRNKNNQAAKQSRCKRRERERSLQDRVKALEQENERLHQELCSIRQQYSELLVRIQTNFGSDFPDSKIGISSHHEQKPPADPYY